ncbi:MAG: nucleotidyltransferase domain-containing protein [Candidatus Edwardsbacteria bacterium]
MKEEVTLDKVKGILLSRKDYLKEVEAVGIFGSLARGNFGERSDIDIFVILRGWKNGDDPQTEWYRRLSKLFSHYRRDVTVLVYSIMGLKKVATWHTLRLASEGILAYDRGRVKKIFEAIVAEAKRVGLVERQIGTRKVWMMNRPLERGEIIKIEVTDDKL